MYLLPNLITISNFTCGVFSIFAVLFSDIDAAILFIILGMLFDLSDGIIARKFHAVSDFGKELDSLSDIVTFCVAPSLLVYSVSLYQLSLIGLLLRFLLASVA